MTGSVVLAESCTVAVPPEQAYDAVMPAPLEQIFRHRFVAIPRIREVRDQQGVWSSVGQTRRIVLADGGTMREELSVVERPHRFGYRMSQIRGPLQWLVAGAQGLWSFEAVGAGTQITWSWTVEPAAGGRLLMPVFGWLWRGYARRALGEIETLLSGS